MTRVPEPPVPGQDTALGRLLAMPREQFAREVWGRRHLLSSREDRGGDEFADLFSLAAVDELITHRGLRTPFFRMAKGGATLPDSAFTSGGGIGAGVGDQVSDDKVRRLFADGATIVLQGLHRTWEPITAFSQQLAGELGHPVQVNAYVTPAQNQGFGSHYDIHDVFVLQVHGTKEWIIHEPPWPLPLRDQPWADHRPEVEAAASAPPALRTVLRPGDCLYLPRGYVHAARALGGTTIHLTIGVHAWTRHHLAESLLDAVRRALGDNPAVRESLPLGVDVAVPAHLDADAQVVRAAIADALAGIDTGVLANALQAKARAAQRPASLAPLAQLQAADALGPADTLVARPHLHATLEPAEGGRTTVRSRAGRFTVPDAVRPALERLLTGAAVTVADIADDPGRAVAEGRRWLVEGVALVR